MSTLKVNNIQNASGGSNSTPEQIQQGRAKAWVNFDGTTNTGGNCDIQDSFNVSTVSDDGTGQYTINFSSAMTNANYAIATAGGGGTGSLSDGCNIHTLTTSSFQSHWGNGGTSHDFPRCHFIVMGDQ